MISPTYSMTMCLAQLARAHEDPNLSWQFEKLHFDILLYLIFLGKFILTINNERKILCPYLSLFLILSFSLSQIFIIPTRQTKPPINTTVSLVCVASADCDTGRRTDKRRRALDKCASVDAARRRAVERRVGRGAAA